MLPQQLPLATATATPTPTASRTRTCTRTPATPTPTLTLLAKATAEGLVAEERYARTGGDKSVWRLQGKLQARAIATGSSKGGSGVGLGDRVLRSVVKVRAGDRVRDIILRAGPRLGLGLGLKLDLGLGFSFRPGPGSV